MAATVQEEIGTRGAITSAYGLIRCGHRVRRDARHRLSRHRQDEVRKDRLRRGSRYRARPNINPAVFERLVAAAEAEGLPYQIEAEPGVTGTDARSIQISRGGVPTGLVSVPCATCTRPPRWSASTTSTQR
ncbi:MAG: hypothetical protein ACLR3C_12955 [Eggerthella lenta]